MRHGLSEDKTVGGGSRDLKMWTSRDLITSSDWYLEPWITISERSTHGGRGESFFVIVCSFPELIDQNEGMFEKLSEWKSVNPRRFEQSLEQIYTHHRFCFHVHR